MRYGICLNMNARDAWGVGYDQIGLAKRIGYDYVELPLTQMTAMPDDAFDGRVLAALSAAGIACEACNNFFPADVKLTGPLADPDSIMGYATRALARAAAVGARVVVMGSSGARNLTRDTSVAEGYTQLARALAIVAPIAMNHGICIAIEPLNRLESNILNSYMSALYLAALSAQENVCALVDAYHFGIGNEPPSDLLTAAPGHVHYAELLGRALPDAPSEYGRAFFRQLRASGYGGRVSLEGAAAPDFACAAEQALGAVRAL